MVKGLIIWLCAADVHLGEEAVVLPLLGENNPLSGSTGLRVGVSSAEKDRFENYKFLANSHSNCAVNFLPSSGM